MLSGEQGQVSISGHLSMELERMAGDGAGLIVGLLLDHGNLGFHLILRTRKRSCQRYQAKLVTVQFHHKPPLRIILLPQMKKSQNLRPRHNSRTRKRHKRSPKQKKSAQIIELQMMRNSQKLRPLHDNL